MNMYIVFFVGIIFLLLILLCYLYVKNKKLSQTKQFLVTTFVSSLAIIGTIIASTISTSSQISNLTINNNVSNTVDNNASNNVNISNIVNIPLVEGSQDLSADDKLRRAELAFDAGEYQSMMDLYSYDDISDSAIRNNNYGYAYANGLYVDRNLETAESYFDKAILEGFEPAFANKFRAAMCQGDVERAVGIIIDWRNNPEHEILEDYFEKNISDKNGVTLNEFCQKLSEGQQIETLKMLMSTEYLGYISKEYPLFDSKIGGYSYNYQYVSHDSTVATNGSNDYDEYRTVTTYTYKVYIGGIVDSDSLNIFSRI